MLLVVGCGGSSEDQEAQSYADSMAEQHEGDSPKATAMASEPIIPVEGSTMAYGMTPAGASITGYIARPENPDSVLKARGLNPEESELPGLIVIHEWWGLNDNIRTTTRRLAGEGYEALAVDLYGGATAETPEQARELMQMATKDLDPLLANLKAAHDFLREEVGSPRVGVIGWCFGGGMALNAALAEPERIDAAVIYYGHIQDAERSELARLEMPVLGFFGAQDGSIPVKEVRDFEQTLKDLGKTVQVYVYDNAGHAFANPSGENYRPEPAADAWDKTTAFLNKYLYAQSAPMSTASE